MHSQIPLWLEKALTRAHQPLPGRRLALLLGSVQIGSVDFTLAHALAEAFSTTGQLTFSAATGTLHLQPPYDASFAAITRWLHVAGHVSTLRNELLAVMDASNTLLARVERAVVRVLGIRTQAVHLMAYVDSGYSSPKIWLQQRAMNKATDPGKWDTLVGGLVSADEPSLEAALAREAWEEAGLRLPLENVPLEQGLTLRESRPVNGSSHMLEDLLSWDITLPAEVIPVNQDGEVAQFACLHWAQVQNLLEQDGLTLEAALVIGASAARRGLLYPPARLLLERYAVPG